MPVSSAFTIRAALRCRGRPERDFWPRMPKPQDAPWPACDRVAPRDSRVARDSEPHAHLLHGQVSSSPPHLEETGVFLWRRRSPRRNTTALASLAVGRARRAADVVRAELHRVDLRHRGLVGFPSLPTRRSRVREHADSLRGPARRHTPGVHFLREPLLQTFSGGGGY